MAGSPDSMVEELHDADTIRWTPSQPNDGPHLIIDAAAEVSRCCRTWVVLIVRMSKCQMTMSCRLMGE